MQSNIYTNKIIKTSKTRQDTSEKALKEAYKGKRGSVAPINEKCIIMQRRRVKMNYLPIDGMMTAEDACKTLEFHVLNLTEAIRKNDNVFFENRVLSVNALINLLKQYVEQEATK